MKDLLAICSIDSPEIKLEIIYRFINHPELTDQIMHLYTSINNQLNFPQNHHIYINYKYYNEEYESIFKKIIKLHFNELSKIISIKVM